MKDAFDILVVGGGMVGLATTALLTADERLRVTLVDAGEKPVFDNGGDVSLRVSAIAPGSVDILSTTGAWPEIAAARVCPYRDMKVWDAAGVVDGPETLSFDAAEFALPQLGFIVENLLIQHALLNSPATTTAELRYATPIAGVNRVGNRFAVELESGEQLSPDLLIGADGVRSAVRQGAGIPVRSWPHAQKALVACLHTELDHQNRAWQRFLRSGPIGILPLADGRVSIVWSTTPDDAEAALAMTDNALGELLTDITDGVLGQLTPSGPRGAFPLRSQHAVTYVQEGLALVGDAAHTVHPLAGQGVNLGFADAAALAATITGALDADEHPGDLPTLRRYERARMGANKTMLRFVDGLNRLFSNQSGSLARLRGAGMYLFNRSGLIRDHAVRTALGLR